MRKADQDTEAKVDIYYNGRHAFVDDDEGNQTNISFAGLSLGASQVMFDDPLYNIYRHAFYALGVESENDVEGNFDGHPVEEYGNTLVMDLFELNSTRTETEGAIVINVWIAAAHEFSNIVRTCRGAQAGDTTIADTMNRAIDRAAALWIGADQVRGDNIHGHLLYNIAENAGELFGQDTGETWVNAQLMDLLNSIQTDIMNDSCLFENGYKEMRVKVHQALSYMTVPLVQMLIHHIMQVKNEAGSDMVELYSLALAPRVAACDPTRYDEMLQMMIFGDLHEADVEKALQLVQSVFSCLDITCKDVGAYQGNVVKECDDSANAKQPMAGYTPSTDVRTKSYIDRDILQIAIFLHYEAYDTAMDWYEYGQNSKYSLYELATNKVSPYPSNQFDLFDSYYNTQLYNFADSIIVKVLSKEKPFDTASVEQRTEIVLGILQSVVMFLSTISELQSAITVCQQNSIPDQNQVLQLWDGGAAFFIGSIEGTQTGGCDGGQLLYSASKDFCQSFQTCEPDDAAVNKAIIQALAFGSQALSQGECNQANNVYQRRILPALYIPLIQGTLLYAQQSVALTAGTKDSSVGGLYAYSRSVLPHINQAWPDSADKLNQTTGFQLTSAPLGGDGLPSIMNDFRNALSHISTDCKEIGSLGEYGGLCGEDIQAVTATGTQSPQITTTNITYTTSTSNGDSPIEPIKPVTSPETSYTNQFDQPNELAWGRYSFSNPQAKKDGSFAMDIKDMRAASDILTTKSIYQDSRHVLTGLFEQADIQSLESFSMLAADMMDQEPTYNFFRFALYEESTFESTGEKQTWSFADMVVKLALNPDNGNDAQLAAEASVVMNVWMIAHRLYDAARMCQVGENPNQILDSAVALWLGEGQQEGKYDAGYMIYNVAQRAQKFYGITTEGEAAVNTDLMAAFNEAKVLGQFCPTQSKAFLKYRVLVFNMIKLLAKPIIQNLMYYISIDDLDYTELYALAVIPQAISCRTSTYLALKAALVDSFSRSTSITDKFYGDFADFLTCLDMICEDLGDTTSASVELKALVSSICQKQQQRRNLQIGFPSPGGITVTASTTTATPTTSAEKTLLAGYLSTVDVSQEARIDMDIRQIDILMRTRAIEAAADLYMYGKNSKTSNRTLLSLQKLATTEDREKIGPPYQVYSSYFLSDTYADELILSVFRKGAIYAKATRSQSAEIVTRALQSMVSYMAVLQKLHASVEACKGNKTSSMKDLDTAVAFYVGSLEGTKFGGNKQGEGLLMYGLAEENCGYFGTCAATGEAKVNRKMIFRLTDMRDRLQMQRCDAAEKVFNDTIVQLMPVPLIESSVRYAAYNEQTGDSPDEDAINLAAGLILTSAVLPLVQAASPESATTISKNVDFTLEIKPIPGGATDIATAFAQSLKSMGVSCEDVGTFSDAGTTDISLCTAESSITVLPSNDRTQITTPKPAAFSNNNNNNSQYHQNPLPYNNNDNIPSGIVEQVPSNIFDNSNVHIPSRPIGLVDTTSSVIGTNDIVMNNNAATTVTDPQMSDNLSSSQEKGSQQHDDDHNATTIIQSGRDEIQVTINTSFLVTKMVYDAPFNINDTNILKAAFISLLRYNISTLLDDDDNSNTNRRRREQRDLLSSSLVEQAASYDTITITTTNSLLRGGAQQQQQHEKQRQEDDDEGTKKKKRQQRVLTTQVTIDTSYLTTGIEMLLKECPKFVNVTTAPYCSIVTAKYNIIVVVHHDASTNANSTTIAAKEEEDLTIIAATVQIRYMNATNYAIDNGYLQSKVDTLTFNINTMMTTQQQSSSDSSSSYIQIYGPTVMRTMLNTVVITIEIPFMVISNATTELSIDDKLLIEEALEVMVEYLLIDAERKLTLTQQQNNNSNNNTPTGNIIIPQKNATQFNNNANQSGGGIAPPLLNNNNDTFLANGGNHTVSAVGDSLEENTASDSMGSNAQIVAGQSSGQRRNKRMLLNIRRKLKMVLEMNSAKIVNLKPCPDIDAGAGVGVGVGFGVVGQQVTPAEKIMSTTITSQQKQQQQQNKYPFFCQMGFLRYSLIFEKDDNERQQQVYDIEAIYEKFNQLTRSMLQDGSFQAKILNLEPNVQYTVVEAAGVVVDDLLTKGAQNNSTTNNDSSGSGSGSGTTTTTSNNKGGSQSILASINDGNNEPGGNSTQQNISINVPNEIAERASVSSSSSRSSSNPFFGCCISVRSLLGVLLFVSLF